MVSTLLYIVHKIGKVLVYACILLIGSADVKNDKTAIKKNIAVECLLEAIYDIPSKKIFLRRNVMYISQNLQAKIV